MTKQEIQEILDQVEQEMEEMTEKILTGSHSRSQSPIDTHMVINMRLGGSIILEELRRRVKESK